MSEKTFSYRELEIWQVGMDIAEAAYRLTADFPADERYGLVSQMRRAAVSIPANIAEGWGRNSQANLANFVKIARGSASELETLVELAKKLKLITEEGAILAALLNTFGRKSYAFLAKVEKTLIREDLALYSNDN